MYDGVVIVNGDIGFSYDLERIFLNEDSCGFVESDADQIGRYADKADKVELPVASEDMLVDDGVFQEG